MSVMPTVAFLNSLSARLMSLPMVVIAACAVRIASPAEYQPLDARVSSLLTAWSCASVFLTAAFALFRAVCALVTACVA